MAIDSAQRVPGRLTVLANGSADPVLQIGFSNLTVGAQDPALFHFSPPAGLNVKRPTSAPEAGVPHSDHEGAMIHTQVPQQVLDEGPTR